MTNVAPTETPNVVVQNPTVRKVANIVLGTALVLFPASMSHRPRWTSPSG
jgi:hypothetical protein